MSALPGYLGALARAGDWLPPEDDAPDDATQTARPRPRGRYEPDGIDDSDWGEVAVEHEVTAPPTQARDVPARPVPAPPPAVDVPVGPAAADTPDTASPEPAATAAPEPRAVEPPAAEPEVKLVGVEPAAPEPPTVPAPVHVEVVTDRSSPVEASAPEAAHFVTVTAAVEPRERPADEQSPPTPDAPEVVTERVVHEARPAAAAPVMPVEEASPAPVHHPVADDGPTIVVEIGRIEVRLAADPVPVPRPAIHPTASAPSLADYLRQRDAAGVLPA